jgi:hypothetical protein
MGNNTRTCEKCLTVIPVGINYFSIVKNLEHTLNSNNDELEIEVVDSIEVIVLCQNCGSNFNEYNISAIINAIPARGMEGRN